MTVIHSFLERMGWWYQEDGNDIVCHNYPETKDFATRHNYTWVVSGALLRVHLKEGDSHGKVIYSSKGKSVKW